MTEYPKMIFKTRQDHTTVNSIEEEEAALKDGYGEYDIVVLGKKPKGKPGPKPKKEKDAELAEKEKAALVELAALVEKNKAEEEAERQAAAKAEEKIKQEAKEKAEEEAKRQAVLKSEEEARKKAESEVNHRKAGQTNKEKSTPPKAHNKKA